jgi:hypothetical protein
VKGYLLIGLGSILVIGFILVAVCTTIGTPGQGTATDSIARVSKQGFIWQTWRVELTNDHPISDGAGGIITQRYGILNNIDLIEKAQNCAEKGNKVKLYYTGNLLVWNWEYSDPEVIYKIEGDC